MMETTSDHTWKGEMEMIIKTLYVPVDGSAHKKEYDDIDVILHSFGEMITTFDSGIEGIGIIAGDQDDPGLTINHLGIRGDFLLIGMKRLHSGMQMHEFKSLEDHEIFGLKMGLEQSIAKGVKVE